MLTGQLFLARPSVAQMSNDEHLMGISGAAGVLAVAQQVSLKVASTPPPKMHFSVFWREKKHQDLFSRHTHINTLSQ